MKGKQLNLDEGFESSDDDEDYLNLSLSPG